MKNLTINLALFLCPLMASPQSELILEKAIESDPKDSLYAYIAVRIGDKIAEDKPTTLVLYKSNGTPFLEEEPHRIYHDFMGKMSFLVNTNQHLESRYQPQIMFELSGMTTYVSNKIGLGFIDREDHFAFGGFVGTYMRRVDSYTRDFTARSHAWQTGELFGGYFQFDSHYFSSFLSSAIEKENDYSRVLFAWKMGKMVHSKIIPEGLRLEVSSETFLGAGCGFSYHGKEDHFSLGVAYLIPRRDEVTKQRIFDRFLATGLNVELEIIGF